MPIQRNARTRQRQDTAQQIRALSTPAASGLGGAAGEEAQLTVTITQTRCDGDSVSGDLVFLGLLDITLFGEPFRLS